MIGKLVSATEIPALAGKMIAEAFCVKEASSGDQLVMIRLTDGTVYEIQAWQEEGRSVEISVSMLERPDDMTEFERIVTA
jgi:hypothetical protein